MNEFDRLVYLTIVYSSCFAFALDESEILRRLPTTFDLQYLFNLTNRIPQKIKITKQKINNSLKKMVQQSIIKTDGKYFFLEKKDLLNRKQKVNLHDFKKEEIKIFVKMASKIPFIKAVALTGSAAVGNAAKEDDLDFMVICQRNTLWLTRFLLILLIKFHKKRPKPDRPGGWCVNLLLDESDLTLDEKRRSLYEAYEILQMQFILDLDEYEKYFLNANDWLKKYLFYYHKYPFAKYKAKLVYSVFNQFFFYLQKSYRQIIFGQENFSVSLTQAFFNNIDFKYQLLKTLERKLGPEKQ